MHDAALVGGAEAIADLQRDLVEPIDGEGLGLAVRVARATELHRVGEALALEVLHHEERGVVGSAAEVGDVDDVRIADARRRLRLEHEAIEDLLVAGVFAPKDLDGDPLADDRVAGRIDHAHSALAEDLVDDVATLESLADVGIGTERDRPR